MTRSPILLFWDEFDGVWVADVPDVRFCSAHGGTAEDALRNVTEALADILAAIPDGESARGAAAFERCERLRGRRLNDIRDTLSRNVWHQLAAQCRAAH